MSAQETLSAWLNHWSDRLSGTSDSARLDAEVLLKHVANLSDVDIISQANDKLEGATASAVEVLLLKRIQGLPIAYLTGAREFYSLELKISDQVLIPRPETELLVDLALETIHHHAVRHILDLGTGSGAIALAIASHAPSTRITALDQSQNAIRLAQENAQHLKLDNIHFLHSNWFTRLNNKTFDLIVANPPYIDAADPHLQRGDVRFEPSQALIALNHGLADLEHIITNSRQHLNSGAHLMLEHGYQQGEQVRELLINNGFSKVKTLQDLAKHDRVTLGQHS